jgi:hypothetical protein
MWHLRQSEINNLRHMNTSVRFDSRRLHQFSFKNLEILRPYDIVRCRKVLAWHSLSIAAIAGTARAVSNGPRR